MLNEFAQIEKCALKKGQIFLVTHDGLFHSDDLMCTALLKLYFERKGVELTIIRTRDPKKIPVTDNLIIYDVFDSILDHHGDDDNYKLSILGCEKDSRICNPISDKVRNYLRTLLYDKQRSDICSDNIDTLSSLSEELFKRRLSSIGKLWRFMKNEIIQEFNIGQEGWLRIDREVISWIDMTDNFVVMNPLTYHMNCMRNCYPPEQAWEKCLEYFTIFLTILFTDSSLLCRDNDELNQLPEIILKNKRFKYAKRFIRGFSVKNSIVGIIWETTRGTLEVKSFGYKKPFLDYQKFLDNKQEDTQVIFVHKNGKHGEFKDLTALNSYMID